jgi:hypothetical protein
LNTPGEVGQPKRYERLLGVRFHIERDGACEWVRIPARRSWFVLPFLLFWITMWTAGGCMAIYSLATDFQRFVLIWLVGWTAGWLFAASTISWQLSGAELLRVDGGDLHRTVRMWGYRKERVYRGSEVRQLAASPASLFQLQQATYPPLFNVPMGGAKFRYGGRMVHIAAGLDEAEGGAIVLWLAERLPFAAVARV